MSDYNQLQRDLQELLDARDNENNPAMLAQIDQRIIQVRDDIAQYPLADDDLFLCVGCLKIMDIENSIQRNHQLFCECCHSATGETSAYDQGVRRDHCYDYMLDHYRAYAAYPMDFEYEGVVYDYDTIISWFAPVELSAIESGLTRHEHSQLQSTIARYASLTGGLPRSVIINEQAFTPDDYSSLCHDEWIQQCLQSYRHEARPAKVPQSPLSNLRDAIDDLSQYMAQRCCGYGAVIELDLSKRSVNRAPRIALHVIAGDSYADALTKFREQSESSGLDDDDFLPDVLTIAFQCAG